MQSPSAGKIPRAEPAFRRRGEKAVVRHPKSSTGLSMLFWLKKTVTLAFLPLSLVLMLGGNGVFLLWTKRWPRVGRWLVSAALLTLAVFSNRGVAILLLRPLESQYGSLPEAADAHALPRELADCQAIVVLGSGNGGPPSWSGLNQLIPSGLVRLAEAVRLARLLPAAKLIVSGNTGSGRISHAQVLEEAAISLGIARERIVRLDNPRDTYEETLEITRQLGKAPFALVTSAVHMPRAMALCRRAGLHPFPCPAGFMIKPEVNEGPDWFIWDPDAFECSTKAIYERLGRFWEILRGQA
jgi:uncharacterized SAM-binding protein YcdF (DUF218 family)